jgi:hypothetical protein
VKLTRKGIGIDEYGITTVDLKELGYRDKPFVLTKDVTQVFYVKDMSSKLKKDKSKGDEPKRCGRTNPLELFRLKCASHHYTGDTNSTHFKWNNPLVCRVTARFNHGYTGSR